MQTEKPALILLVDDTAATRYATSRVLRHAGFEVVEAVNGTEALEIATKTPVDLVVLDINMPDFDGYEVCRRIRTMPSTQRVRVVYLSASFVDDTHKVQGFEVGADGFLTHPVEPAVLIASVGALLRTSAIEKELQQLLERERSARDEAERANRAKDDFLATLSHELRSPLAAIVGWAEVARQLAADRADLQKPLNAITRNARVQVQLVSDLLDVSRITSGNLHSDMEVVSLLEVVNTSTESVMATAQEHDIHLEVNIDGYPIFVNGDSGQLQQIIVNLLNNAVKFSSRGGHVLLSVRASGENAQVAVQDHGLGIAPDALTKIFDRFWQQDTSSRRKHGGLGLGLSIVKHLTELHGGSIAVASEGEGRGATFTVTLPLVDAGGNRSMQGGKTLSADGADASSLHGLRVLIVDDDADGRAWVKQVISRSGADVVDVGAVDEAVSTLESFEPHVILADLAMPGRDGFDLMRMLVESGHSQKAGIVALSAYASFDDRKRALDAGFHDFLTKPPESRDLLRVISRAGREPGVRASKNDRPASSQSNANKT